MAVEVFNRYEDKYIIDRSAFERVTKIIEAHMDKDIYNKDNKFYPISNIYYDTHDYNLIRTSLQKPRYKEKLRLRSYGTAAKDSEVFLEIKKKYRGIVNKRRTVLTLSEALEFIKSGKPPEYKDYMNKQVMNELEFFINNYRLEAKAYISYSRMAFFGRDNSDLRISFDTNICGRVYNLSLASPAGGAPVLGNGLYLMEIKTRFSKPLWLTRLLTEENIRRVSFSKYGSYYKMLLDCDCEEGCINL